MSMSRLHFQFRLRIFKKKLFKIWKERYISLLPTMKTLSLITGIDYIL